MRSSAFRALSLGAALSVGASLLVAQPPRSADQPPRRGAEQMQRRAGGSPLFRDITLTEAQQTRVREIQQRYAQERRQLTESLRGDRPANDRARMRERQRPDSAARAQRRAEMEKVRPQLQQLSERQYADLRAVLTGAQQTTFDRNVTELKQRMSERTTGRGPARGERGARRGGPDARALHGEHGAHGAGAKQGGVGHDA